MPVKPIKRPGRLLERLFFVLAALLVAGIVHIVLILTIPRHADHDAYATVAALAGGVPLKTIAGPPISARVMPYRDPAVTSTFCLYDLATGPIKVEATVGDADFLAVSLHARRGPTFYGLTDRSGSNGRVALTLMTSAQLAAAQAKDPEDTPVEELRVQAPESTGFVAVDALAVAPSGRPAAETAALTLKCEPAGQH